MTPQELAAAARCFECIPPGMRGAVIISLLDQIAAGGGGGGGSQTPWLSDIDGDGFDLSDVDSISSNSLTLANGTAAAPSLNLGDAATGLYRPAVNAFGISTAGTGRWQFNASGHLLTITDNVYDIGTVAGNRPRSLYTGQNVSTVELQTVVLELGMGAGSWIRGSTDGVIKLSNSSETDFSRIQLGGTTSSFPSLKRSTTLVQARLADDSAFCGLQGILTTNANAVTGLVAGALAASTNATITITDASGQVYRVPAII